MRSRSGWAALGWTAAFVAGGALLWRFGQVDWLVVDWSDPLGWLSTVEVEVALAALGRVAALTMLGWIGLSTIAYLLGRLVGIDGSSIDWLSFGPARRAIDAVLAGYLMIGSMAPAGAVVESQSDAGAAGTSRQVEVVDPAYVPIPAGSDPGATPPVDETQAPTGVGAVVVAPGDSLWTIAADHLAEVLGHVPDDREIATYWREVVEVNRPQIRSGNPDLIFPGEEITLPPVAP